MKGVEGMEEVEVRGGDDAADALRYLIAAKARAVEQRKLRGGVRCRVGGDDKPLLRTPICT
jgi:hypothetical protein